MKRYTVILAALILAGCAGINWRSFYTPGVFEGQGEGRNGPIRLSVTVSEFAIIDVQAIEHSETPGVGGEALETLIESTLEGNTADVDWVSGATYTSEGYTEALNAALAKAKSQ